MKRALCIMAIGLILPATTQAAATDQQSLEALRAQAERGNVTAQLDMGILYEYGFNFPDNKAPALAWYTLAADQGNELAAKRRDLIKAKMTPAEIEQANQLAREFLAKTPKGGAPAEAAAPLSAPPAAEAAPPAAETPVPVPAPDAPPPEPAPAKP